MSVARGGGGVVACFWHTLCVYGVGGWAEKQYYRGRPAWVTGPRSCLWRHHAEARFQSSRAPLGASRCSALRGLGARVTHPLPLVPVCGSQTRA